jgi:CBS domain containing-hemolysin-like protein
MNVIGEITPYLLALAALLCGAAFFSGTEVAMFSLRRVDREQLARTGRTGDSLVLRLLAQPRRLIATVLIGNESVNVSISATMAAMVPRLFPGLGHFALALVATGMALPLILCVGEIGPKTVALRFPVSWVRVTGRPIWLFSMLVTPIRLIVNFLAAVVLRPFGAAGRGKGEQRDLSKEEFRTLVDAGTTEGEVDARERRLIHRVFEFGGKSVGQIMTPRDKIFALSYDLPMARLVKEIAERGYSRIPIYSKSLDNIRGILNAKDLVLAGTGLTKARPLAELLHEALFVPRTIPVKRLFRIFKQRKVHVAMVVNEYGKLIGIVTMEDVLEQLFGEIRDEREQLKAAGQPRRGRGRNPTKLVVSGPGAAAEVALAPTGAVVEGFALAEGEPDQDSGPVSLTEAIAAMPDGGVRPPSRRSRSQMIALPPTDFGDGETSDVRDPSEVRDPGEPPPDAGAEPVSGIPDEEGR